MSLLRIALSGGPSSGKTTFLALACIYFRMIGYNVYIAEEIASLMIKSGMSFRHIKTKEGIYKFQKNLLQRLLLQEDGLVEYVKENTSDQRNIIISDRGALDPKAYMEVDEWNRLLSELSTTESELYSRYDSVIFLDANVSHYTVDNNSARTETLSEAIVQSELTKAVWKDHPKIIVSKSQKHFINKYEYAIQKLNELCKVDNGCNILKQKYKYVVTSDIFSLFTPIWFTCYKTFVDNVDDKIYKTIRLIAIDDTFFVLMKEYHDGTYQECIITKQQYEYEMLNKIGNTLIVKNAFVTYDDITIGLEEIANCGYYFIRSAVELTDDQISKLKSTNVTGDPHYSSFGIATMSRYPI